jgi:hypothetical protein
LPPTLWFTAPALPGGPGHVASIDNMEMKMSAGYGYTVRGIVKESAPAKKATKAVKAKAPAKKKAAKKKK